MVKALEGTGLHTPERETVVNVVMPGLTQRRNASTIVENLLRDGN